MSKYFNKKYDRIFTVRDEFFTIDYFPNVSGYLLPFINDNISSLIWNNTWDIRTHILNHILEDITCRVTKFNIFNLDEAWNNL